MQHYHSSHVFSASSARLNVEIPPPLSSFESGMAKDHEATSARDGCNTPAQNISAQEQSRLEVRDQPRSVGSLQPVRESDTNVAEGTGKVHSECHANSECRVNEGKAPEHAKHHLSSPTTGFGAEAAPGRLGQNLEPHQDAGLEAIAARTRSGSLTCSSSSTSLLAISAAGEEVEQSASSLAAPGAVRYTDKGMRRRRSNGESMEGDMVKSDALESSPTVLAVARGSKGILNVDVSAMTVLLVISNVVVMLLLVAEYRTYFML